MSQAPCTLFWPRRGFTPAKLFAYVPAEHSQVRDGFDGVGAVDVLRDAHGIGDGGGGAEAYNRAAAASFSLGIPEIASTLSGVYPATTFFSSSNPSVRSATYCLSYNSSLMITFIMPLSQATSASRLLPEPDFRVSDQFDLPRIHPR